jgi:hypothetical protein
MENRESLNQFFGKFKTKTQIELFFISKGFDWKERIIWIQENERFEYHLEVSTKIFSKDQQKTVIDKYLRIKGIYYKASEINDIRFAERFAQDKYIQALPLLKAACRKWPQLLNK